MDDFVSSSNIELTKGLTEESQSMSHRRNKDNNPTHVQKRKHQITYLAFQVQTGFCFPWLQGSPVVQTPNHLPCISGTDWILFSMVTG